MKIILATGNAHKVAEFRAAFAENGYDIEILTPRDVGFSGDIVETADSFEGNAFIKAKALCDFTGSIAVADDSGLETDALCGAPGVYSARFAGENATDAENNKKLLGLLENVPAAERTARFVCVVCACKPNGERIFVRGESRGSIIDTPRGADGFGYDPIFLHESGKTFAEMTQAEKNAVSHRGSAIKQLILHGDFFK